MEYLQNILKTFLYLVILTCEKLKIIITDKCSNLSSKTIFRFYFICRTLPYNLEKLVFAVVTKVSALAYPSANKHNKLGSDFCYSCINVK